MKSISISRLLFIIALLLLIAFSCWQCSTIDGDSPPDRLYGKPVISTDSPEISSMEAVVDDGQRLYVLYTHLNGIIQVYDLNGNYQHTLYFYCHQHGGFSIAAEETTVYVKDMDGNLYIFEDGEFQSFVYEKHIQGLLDSVDFSKQSEDYVIREDGLYKKTESVEQCIVSLENQKTIKQTKNVYMWIAALAAIFFIQICKTGLKDFLRK